MKRVLLLLALPGLLTAQGALPVIDVSVLGKLIEDVRIATEQLEQVTTLVDRMGNPADVRLDGVRDLLRSINQMGVGVPLDELQEMASGLEGVLYEAHGLYRALGEVVTTADGAAFPRMTEAYRKYNATTRARVALEEVMDDTDQRRQAVRDQMFLTVVQVRAAETQAEVAKLHAILTAQAAELAAIDRERDAAQARVMAQRTENETDAARQDWARLEERMVDFRTASGQLSRFLTPDPSPVRIPEPGERHP